VQIRARLVDTVTDRRETGELIRSGSVDRLSIEFLPLPGHRRVTPVDGGGQLVEHSKVLLVGVGVGVVRQPAYRSARVTRLLDRVEAGRQRDHDRRKEIRALKSLNHH
jgi:phage head maturation protease